MSEVILNFVLATFPGASDLMYTIPKKIKDKNEKIVIWCRNYRRPCYAGIFLAMYGYTNVWWYQEGVEGWISAGFPL